MADRVVAKDEPGQGEPRAVIPEAQYIAALADVIDLGEKADSYMGGPLRLSPKVALVFQTADFDPDTKRRYTVSKEFTVSMGQKANLRAFLENWRGKSYTDEEARLGVDLAGLLGVNAAISVEHKPSKRDASKSYPNIRSIAPVPKGLPKITVEGYERAPWWADRKKEYYEGAKQLIQERDAAAAKAARAAKETENDFPSALQDEEDDLPF